MSKEERDKLGSLGREHILKNYSYKALELSWQTLIEDVIEKHGAWNERKGYETWKLLEL